MNTMQLAHLEDANRRQRRARRVAPIRTPADAAQQIFDWYDAAVKGLMPAKDAYYLSATLKNLADLRLMESLSDNIVDEFDARLKALEAQADPLK